MKRVAGIDLGSNTFILTIADLDSSDKIHSILVDEVRFVRLGQDVDATKRLHLDALARAQEALREFRSILDQYQVTNVFATATSAARDAVNGFELLAIGKTFNFSIQIISGLEEARLTYLGAFSMLTPSAVNWVIDIGGGSTEIILGHFQAITWRHSFNFGCVRLTEQNKLTIPCSKDHWSNLYVSIQKQMLTHLPKEYQIQRGFVLGVAGTAVEIDRILEQLGFDKSLNSLELLLLKLSNYSVNQIVEEFKTQPKRADVLFAGILIFTAFIKIIGAQNFAVTRTGIRYGNLLQAAKLS